MERIFPVKKQGDKNVNCFKPTPFSSERIVLNLLEKRLNFSYNRTNKGKGKTSIACNIFKKKGGGYH